MATCTTLTAQEPFRRTPTPRPTSLCRIVTKRVSYQSLRSPVLMSPTEGRPFSSVGSQDSPGWEHINVISPSTASHHSICSDTDESFRSPQLALRTNNLLGSHLHEDREELNTLISPSAPVQLPGDELLYDVDKEEKPDEPFFNPEFQAALKVTKQEIKDISLAIWGCPASHQLGSDLHGLKQSAQRLSEFEPSRTRTVVFVGDRGVGKSSVINSLLDQPHLAQSSFDDGHSTSMITEYRFRSAHYNEPFSIEVDYMTTEEIKELIEELLRSFRACHIQSFQSVDDMEERRDIRARSEKAWHTLHAMFRNKPIFTEEFLLEYPTEADTPLINVLQQWATKFLTNRPGGHSARSWASTAYTIDQCADKLTAFVNDPVDHNTAALWPYIRLIRIFTRAAILQSGLVLVDCPSPRDLDFSRARVIERHLRNSHEVFAVTTMDRALSDKGILDIVKRNSRHRPLRIICTNSENIVPREVERKAPEVSLQVSTWRQQIESLRKQVKRVEAQRRHGLLGALEEEARTRDMLDEMEFGLKKFLMERRNCHVATELIDKYAGDVQLGDLKIFCISNKDYWQHRYDEQQLAETRLDLSGIVNLRKYCHSIPTEAQFEEAATFMEYDAPAFLLSLQQWFVTGADSLGADKAAEVRQLMKSLEEIAITKLVLPSAQVHTTRTNLNHEFASAIVLPIRENRSEWRSAALEASKEWTKWDSDDYVAFCRNHGTHTTKQTGFRNWNEELIAPMRLQLQSNWGFFQESVEESEKELTGSVKQVFDELCAPLKEHLADAPIALQNLIDNVAPRASSITQGIRTSFTDLLEGTSQLESDLLYGHLSSYINTLMAPAYQSASSFIPSSPTASPSLLDQQRKEIITTHIASARIFPKLSTMIEKSHRAFVCATFDAMIANITREVDAFIRDVGLVVCDEEKSELEKFGEFGVRLRARIRVAERRLKDVGMVVRDVRAMMGGSQCGD